MVKHYTTTFFLCCFCIFCCFFFVASALVLFWGIYGFNKIGWINIKGFSVFFFIFIMKTLCKLFPMHKINTYLALWLHFLETIYSIASWQYICNALFIAKTKCNTSVIKHLWQTHVFSRLQFADFEQLNFYCSRHSRHMFW